MNMMIKTVPGALLVGVATSAQADDAALMSLDRQLTEASEEWSKWVKESEEVSDGFEAEVLRRTGVTLDEARARFIKPDGEETFEYEKYWEVRRSVSNSINLEEPGDADERYDAICETLAPIIEQIRRTPASTLAGLGVKARAMMISNHAAWRGGGSMIEDESLVSFVESVLTVTGACRIDCLPRPHQENA